MFYSQVLNPLVKCITNYGSKNAFYISGKYYTYNEFAKYISKIRIAIQLTKTESSNIGLVANDDIETYAAIIALWLEGKCYVPVNPETPAERNRNILKQAGSSLIIDSSELALLAELNIIKSDESTFKKLDLIPVVVSDEALAYIFFTSGTTGIPKGVPISRSNLSGFIMAFFALDLKIDSTDKCLQMFELTFDLSVISFLVPLLKGACVYTIPKNKTKFNYIAELLDQHHLTFALMVPSIIHYLRPYFNEINFKSMKYSLFCGEALPIDVTKGWGKCIPNATIMNVYGPTEGTIFCTHYTYTRGAGNKTSNGLLSIGQAMWGTFTIIVNENDEIVNSGEIGQLCLGGVQLTPGYWNNKDKNKEAFFYKEYNGVAIRFYKTGDRCSIDSDGDIMYLGRIDSQIKVQGFRVELSEIEFFAKEYLQKLNAVAIAFTNQISNTEIAMVIESDEFNTKEIINYLKTKMPGYMIPTQFRFIDLFPLNTNGKVDRNMLKKLILTENELFSIKNCDIE